MYESPHATPDAPYLRVGEAVVEPDTREIRMPGMQSPFRVTPKAMAVLCMLAETPGRVHARNDLLAAIWPDTFPTDDVLTQAIAQLRKAFSAGGDDDGRRYIETIAKTGYRLTVDVEHVPAGEAAAATDAGLHPATRDASLPPPASDPAGATTAAPGSPARRSGKRRLPAIAAAAAIVALLAAGAWWLQAGWRPAPQTPEAAAAPPPALMPISPGRPYRLVTTTPGFELSPTLSPDGSMVAFVARDGATAGRSTIRIQTTDNVPSRRLSSGPEDVLPAWSPGGQQIAFARHDGNGDCRIMLVSASGGDERTIAGCGGSELLSFDWSIDGRTLLFGSMSGDPQGTGIRYLDPVSGRWRAVGYDTADGQLDVQPRQSPDGRWIGFVRNPQLGDLWRIPADGGPAERLTRLGAELRGWSWLPDSRSIVFSMRVDTESRLYRLDTADGSIEDLELPGIQNPTAAASGTTMAFVHRDPRFGIYRVALDGSGAKQRLFPSSGRDAQPVVSPDGRQIVFASDRSGQPELWWAELERPETLRPLEGFHPDMRQPANWSQDGRRLLVTGWEPSGNTFLAELAPDSGQFVRLPVPAVRPLSGLDTGDASRLLVLQEAATGSPELVLYDRTAVPWRIVARLPDVSQARMIPGGAGIFFTRLDGSGMWWADTTLETASIRQAIARHPTRWRYRSWTIDAAGTLAYLRFDPACNAMLGVMPTTGGRPAPQSARAHCLDPESNGAINGFSMDGARSVAYVALADSDGTDIGVMPLPVRPRRLRDPTRE